MKVAPFRQIVLGAAVCAVAAVCGTTPGETPVTAGPPERGPGVSVTAGVGYGFYEMEASHFPLVLDLYRPSGVAQPSPLLVFIHGGGWIEGSREDCPGGTFTRYGYAAACVDYRPA